MKMGLDGVVHLRLSCRDSTSADCAGSASLQTQRRLVLGKSPFLIANGNDAVLSIRLSKRKQRLVRKRERVRAIVIVEARDAGGKAQTTKKAMTLRATKA